MICDTTQIKVGNRLFGTIEQVWESTFTKGVEKELLGDDRIYWYDDLVIMFPDKQNSSTAMVEIHNAKTICVGYPNNYVEWNEPTRERALKVADSINQHWLSFTGNAFDFVKEIENTSQLESQGITG